MTAIKRTLIFKTAIFILHHDSKFIALSGIAERWKQVVAYHFTDSSISGGSLVELLKTVQAAPSRIGLKVITVTSDMGPSNQAMWRTLGIQARKDSLTSCIVNPSDHSLNLHFLADVPHVTKNLCCALLTHKTFLLADVCTNFGLPITRISSALNQIDEHNWISLQSSHRNH
jgi:hypothetical protein